MTVDSSSLKQKLSFLQFNGENKDPPNSEIYIFGLA